MLGRTDSRLRLVLLLVVVVGFGGVLGLRLAYWQIGQAGDLRRLADAQLHEPLDAEIRRGDITDRRGNLLATTAYRDLLAAHPDLIRAEHRADQARRLAGVLELDAEQEAHLIERYEAGVPYFIVARRLGEQQSRLVRELIASGELAALTLEPRPARFYPNTGGAPDTTLASQLLGFVTDDGQGQYGIEQRHQQLLAGRAGPIASVDDDVAGTVTGGSLQLTIDASLQLRVEKELYAAWVANRAERASAVVMDPYTGAILAWASVPGYDANAYGAVASKSPERFVDPLASQVYEPGSVMKMLTAAAALERGVVTLDSTVRDGARLRFGQTVISNFDQRSMGRMTFADVIAQSRNVGTGRVAMRLGETTDESAAVLYEMWLRLGLGQRTGVETASEAAGLVADPAARPWHDVDLVNRAFGQGVAVTPLQLAAAFGAMVNGGWLPHPHVVAAENDAPTPVAAAVPVFAPALSDELRDLMVHVVASVPHYAETTLIPNYVVGGKTGTAQIWDAARGAWKEHSYNHTFAGFVGGEQPAAVIIVRIHDAEPTVKRRFGYILALTSNEVFRRVAQDVIEVLDLPPLQQPAPVSTPPLDLGSVAGDEP